MRIVFFYLLAVLTVAAAEPSGEWKHVQQFEVAQPGLIKLSLPAETLNAARPALEDMRILDAAGREMPFLIERPSRSAAVEHRAKRFDVNLAGQATVISVETGVAQPIEAITLETPASGFIKAAKVEGSRDRQSWQTLADGQPVFRQPNGASQLRVVIPAGVWPFLRVTVDDRRAEAIPFTGARLHAVTEVPSPVEPLPVSVVERTENDGHTRLVLDLGAAHLTLASLRFESDEPLFTRPVSLAVRQIAENVITEQVLARDTVYRVAVEGFPSAERVEVPFELNVPGRELLVLVDNGDSPPLKIAAVRATRRPVYAVFLALQGGPYRLLTGNPRCSAPRYDVAALGQRLKDAAVTPIRLTAPADNPAYAPAEPLPEIQNLGAALDVTEWSRRKRVDLTRAGVQQVELDLDVVAQADPSFRDLRLMRDGKQRPYILERTSIQRRLAPEISPVNDPKRPTVSRWQIKLSKARLPVTRLTCTTGTALFRRQMRLYERPTDERGERYDRSLGQATWVRTPPAWTGTLSLTFDTSPVTDTLLLETDNGDNPAIELRDFAVFYPVTRVLFKAPAEPATFLYYGNGSAGFPQYDLDLIAPRLLAEEKATATLAAEEQLKKSAVGELFQLSSTKSVVFWVALALVVVVLLVVIARLLPKNPPTQG
jgi:hypothetical protein